jgi:hypothetical protein
MNTEPLNRALHDLRPDQVEAYLIDTGWQRDGEIGNRASIWHRPEENLKDYEVILPGNQRAKDYLDRIADVMYVLAEFEKREASEIARASAGYFADHIRVRVIHQDVQDGTIPLHDGVLLNLRARDVIAAGTLSTIAKRKQFFGKRPPNVQEFLESLRLGQTEVGSYVVNIIAPVKMQPPELETIPTTSLARLVTTNLTESLTALSVAIDKYIVAPDPTVFESAIASGVSANMCDALVGLSGESKTRGFEITITPSAGDRLEIEPKTFLFSSEKVQFISAASEYYKDDYILPDQTVVGFIKRLDRPKGEEIGTVTIQATLLGMEKNVSVELQSDDYILAVSAHRANQIVTCRGDVHVKTRSATLLSQTGFGILKSEDLF